MYSKPEYLTAAKTFATILAEGGPLNFWRGLLPRMTRIIGGRARARRGACRGRACGALIARAARSRPARRPGRAGATFLLINVRAAAVGYLEEQRDPRRIALDAVAQASGP